jgi:hypothetical protein
MSVRVIVVVSLIPDRFASCPSDASTVRYFLHCRVSPNVLDISLVFFCFFAASAAAAAAAAASCRRQCELANTVARPMIKVITQ